MGEEKRIVFLDYLRIFACFLVMLVHSCEPFYFDASGNTHFASASDAFWVTLLDSFARIAVPLFVMTSSYLLFPLRGAPGSFFRRRALRILPAYALWTAVYVALARGNWAKLLFNFPDEGGHLWFVPMLLGVYLLIPLLSPWAERATEREVRGWLAVWLVTTLFPYARRLWAHLYGAPAFGAVPYLWGECPWNAFGTFHYVSGFFGYLLLGFYFRRFAGEWSWRRTLAAAVPLCAAGYAVTAVAFYLRIPSEGGFPVTRPYAFAVDLEMSWEYCSTGVALMTAAVFLVFRKFGSEGGFYRWFVRPCSEASYGTYLLHMLILTPLMGALRALLPTPAAILATACSTFLLASAAGFLLRKIPFAGRFAG